MIRVLIDRTVADNMEAEFHTALKTARKSAAGFPGYISGETLRDVSNSHHHVVISTWRSIPDWETWLASEERQQLVTATSMCLDEPTTFTVLEPM